MIGSMIGWKTLEQATATHLLGVISSVDLKQMESIGNYQQHVLRQDVSRSIIIRLRLMREIDQ
jgi:hypothetical protein